jgi:phosphoglycerate dehydrogenase-like enzyme
VHVAWFSNDLFSGGGGAQWFVPNFMGAPELRWLHSSTAGLDSPIFGALMGRGVRVTGAHIYAPQISEYVLRSALDWFQGADAWRASEAAGTWQATEFREVSGSTWLVIGLGDIGRAVAERARALGVRVLGVVRTRRGDEPVDELVDADGLLDAVGRADVVVLTLSVEPGSPPLVDEQFLAAAKPGSLLVNVARGSLVDEDALVAALDRGAPGRAALDVFATEPLPEGHPFWSNPNVVVTAHTAGQGAGRFSRGADAFAENLRRFVADQPLLDEATPPSA